MVKTHYIKLLQDFADAIVTGEKTFEIRRNDRGYQRGDRVVFQAVERAADGEKYPIQHEINNRMYEITYVLNGFGLVNGFVAFGIREAGEIVDEREYQ